MICETIKPYLVAYRDGELPERERAQVAAHLSTCPACTREEAQLARVSQMLRGMERIAPSPDFAATFWRRLEQEDHRVEPEEMESPFARWLRDVQEWLTGWRLAPALAAAASLLVFFSFLLSGRFTTTPTPPAPQTAKVAEEGTGDAPAPLVEKPDFFVNYRIITDLDRLSHLEEIAAVELPTTAQETELASEDNLPPELLKDPSFFVQYPMLQKMDELQNLEAVLSLPGEGNEQTRG
jgi:hypothetical protein